jgi:hypothetical protein
MIVKGDFNRAGVACPKCGVVNDLGHAFCRKCGTRIYQEGLGPLAEKKKRNSRMLAIQASVASFVFFFLAVVFGLMAWPFVPLGTVGPASEAVHTQRVLMQMERDLTTASPWRGYAVAESGFNAYSEANIREPRVLRISAAEDQVVAVSQSEVLGFRLSTRVVMVPSEEKGYFVPYSLWLGHLPLPVRFAGRLARSRAEEMGLEVKDVIWERVRIERVERSTMILTLRDAEDG